MNEVALRPAFSLESMDEFRAALATIHDLDEIRQLHDLAEAARRYAQTEEQQRKAAEAKLWTAFRGGELLAASGLTNKPVRQLPEGIDKFKSHQWQRLYTKTAEWLENYLDAAEEPTMAEALRVKDVGELLVASDQNEWYTPPQYIEAARRALGGIDLDPASSAEANQIVQATKFFSAEDDGFEREWSGRVFLNPPYGRLAGDFVLRLVAEYEADHVKAAIALVNAHCTDTAWFQPLWNHTLCFTDHRIDFDSAGREKKTSSTHGSVFVYLGADAHGFADHFSEFGPIVRRMS